MTAITVSNVTSRTAGQKFFDAINGQSYMDFQVKFAPAYGSFDVIVETDYDGTQEEIQGMLMMLMFDVIRRG